jgi:hypothetical protein
MDTISEVSKDGPVAAGILHKEMSLRIPLQQAVSLRLIMSSGVDTE